MPGAVGSLPKFFFSQRKKKRSVFLLPRLKRTSEAQRIVSFSSSHAMLIFLLFCSSLLALFLRMIQHSFQPPLFATPGSYISYFLPFFLCSFLKFLHFVKCVRDNPSPDHVEDHAPPFPLLSVLISHLALFFFIFPFPSS